MAGGRAGSGGLELGREEKWVQQPPPACGNTRSGLLHSSAVACRPANELGAVSMNFLCFVPRSRAAPRGYTNTNMSTEISRHFSGSLRLSFLLGWATISAQSQIKPPTDFTSLHVTAEAKISPHGELLPRTTVHCSAAAGGGGPVCSDHPTNVRS